MQRALGVTLTFVAPHLWVVSRRRNKQTRSHFDWNTPNRSGHFWLWGVNTQLSADFTPCKVWGYLFYLFIFLAVTVASCCLMMDLIQFSIIISTGMFQTSPATISTPPPLICMFSISAARLQDYCITGQIIVHINVDGGKNPGVSVLCRAKDMIIHSWVHRADTNRLQQQAGIYYTSKQRIRVYEHKFMWNLLS